MLTCIVAYLNAYILTCWYWMLTCLQYLGPSIYNGDSIPNCGAQVLSEAYIKQLQD